MKILMHQQPYKEILWTWVLKNTSLWGLLLLHDFSLAWFVFVIATLEIVLPNHTWNIIISSKPCFVIIKIEINQTLVSHFIYLLDFKWLNDYKRMHLYLKKLIHFNWLIISIPQYFITIYSNWILLIWKMMWIQLYFML